jgi:hypothetical protein
MFVSGWQNPVAGIPSRSPTYLHSRRLGKHVTSWRCIGTVQACCIGLLSHNNAAAWHFVSDSCASADDQAWVLRRVHFRVRFEDSEKPQDRMAE